MAKVKDDNQNPIEVGSLVCMTLANPFVKGRIIDIKDGGMLLGKPIKVGNEMVQQMEPGKITVYVELEFQFDPRNPVVQGVQALIDPQPDKAAQIKADFEKQGGKRSSLLALPN